jgi:ethanolamine utilization protein EutQ
MRELQNVTHLTAGGVDTWYRSGDRRIFLSDVVDRTNGETMSVGFARYAPGEANDWVVTYDEALVVTRGTYTVASADGIEATARAGEVIFLRKGTALTYSAGRAGAEVVYVTYPHWTAAQEASEHAALLDRFQPDPGGPGDDAVATDAIALLRSIYDPIVRGESDDLGPFFDALADDVVFTLPVGELRGKDEVAGYFTAGSDAMEFHPFDRPLEYYGEGERVVVLGDERFRDRRTGATHHAEWAWVFDVHDGLITRIVAIQDLSGITETIREVVERARAGRLV